MERIEEIQEAMEGWSRGNR